MSVDRAGYWSRTLKTFAGLHVTVTKRGDVPGSVEKVHGVVEAIGQNHVRLSGGVEVRYDKLLEVEP